MLDDAARALLKQSVSIIFGSVDEMNTPEATRASGAAVLDDHRLRVLIAADATESRSNAVQGARVSVLVTDVNTYQSVQWKGRVLHDPLAAYCRRHRGDPRLSGEVPPRSGSERGVAGACSIHLFARHGGGRDRSRRAVRPDPRCRAGRKVSG